VSRQQGLRLRRAGGAGGWLGALAGRHGSVLLNAGSLFSTTVLTAGVGAVYWAVAARLFEPSAVGLAAAAISAMQLIAQISTLGLGTVLIGELPQHRGSERSLVFSALGITVPFAAVLAIVFALAAGWIIPELRPLGDLVAAALFAVGVAVAAAGLVLDQAFIGILRAGLQLARNAVASVMKLLALVAVGLTALLVHDGLSLYLTWVAGTMLSMALILRLPRQLRAGRHALIWQVTQGLAGVAIRHHLFNLSILVPGLLLPLVITAVLSTDANAYFYIAYLIASFVFAIPAALATALYAAAVRDAEGLVGLVRLGLGLCLAIAIALTLFMVVAAAPLLSIFGREYAERASDLLPLFTLGLIPVTINSLFVPIARVEQRFAEGVALMTLGTVIELLFVIVGAHLDGLHGAATGWLVGYSVGTLPLLPTVLRVAVGGSLQRVATDRGSAARSAAAPPGAEGEQ
jgi:O-antigen/teichoic acid export membrane protein